MPYSELSSWRIELCVPGLRTATRESEDRPLSSRDLEPKRTQSTHVKAALTLMKGKDKVGIPVRAFDNNKIDA